MFNLHAYERVSNIMLNFSVLFFYSRAAIKKKIYLVAYSLQCSIIITCDFLFWTCLREILILKDKEDRGHG